MEKFGKSQPVKRFEDQRFLTGRGRYVDDIAPEGALHAFVFRSPVAHARITSLDVSAAAEAEGVALVLTAADLAAMGATNAMETDPVENKDGSKGAGRCGRSLRRRPGVLRGRAGGAGRGRRRRAGAGCGGADRLRLRGHARIGGDRARGADDPPGGAGEPRLRLWARGCGGGRGGDGGGGASRGVHAVEHNRIMVASMEPRGAYAEWDGARLHLCVNGQGVWGQKDELVGAFGLAPEAVRVTNPDVGGGFGMKG
jgi:aerobic carbon-monoxide dehydrogenase large subunit